MSISKQIQAVLLLETAEREPVVVDDATAVDRVARAIFAVRDDPYDLNEWDDLDSAQREPYECQARAAVAALTPDGQDA